jgi:alkylation response protein AidB-like acyl-CoA dehydrogenase
MTAALRFDPIRLPPECEVLRKQVRAFLAEEIAAGTFDPHKPNREDTDAPEFSRRVGERGWLGMTWPKKYGGHERSFLERYVVTEEMRVANAPTRRFFVADRQSGPVLLKYAPEHIKLDILPRICRGEVCFSIGMSEPNSGSDLFAAKTKATKTDGGWLINGTKIWTSSAHIADYMIAIFRTSPPTKENRRHGLTQFLVDMKKTPGIKVNPIGQITGQFEFNEVVFTDAFMPDDHVLGEIDGAWKQATSELAYERSGPERFLETYYVLTELVRAVGSKPDTRSAEGIGKLVAQLHTMRRMSVSVAGMLQAGKEPVVEASIVKDIGTIWEQQLPHRVRTGGVRRCRCIEPCDAGGSVIVRDQDRAETDDPGRYHGSAARHHRARAWAALIHDAARSASRRVMAGLVPAIHVFNAEKTSMPGTSPGMTRERFGQDRRPS